MGAQKKKYKIEIQINIPNNNDMKKNLLFLMAILIVACSPKSKDMITTDASKTKAKPNIIFIFCDDLTTQAISAYGDIFKDIAPTPNMDRIAKDGMVFQGVMCTNAICGPSRACVLTGQYNHINKYYKNENGGQFDNTQWTFPQDFQKNGYATSLFGKWHLGTKPVGFDHFMYHTSSGQQGLYWNPTYDENGVEKKTQGYATNITTDAALNWLKASAPQGGKPFMMMLQYKAPHRPWEPDKKYETLWDDVEMPYPATFNDKYVGREQTAGDTEMTMDHLSRRDMKLPAPKELTGKDKLAWEFYGQKNGELVQPEGMSREEGKKWRYQRYIKDYLACVKSVDDNIGRVLDYLKQTGQDQNTVIVLSSDQGFYLGDHGFYDKRFIYDESLRMPFIMKYPGVIKPGSENKDILTNIDFAPTLLDIAGIKPTSTMQGKSFKSMLDGTPNPEWRQSMYYHYYEFPFWHHVQPHYGIRTQRYTLAHFYYNIDKWELYDNQKDPDQMNNVINDPRYTATVADLKSQIKKLQKEYKNEFPLEHYKSITDKDFGRINAENENVEQIINGGKKQ
jgi:arylsulfatase A-like enzyme